VDGTRVVSTAAHITDNLVATDLFVCGLVGKRLVPIVDGKVRATKPPVSCDIILESGCGPLEAWGALLDERGDTFDIVGREPEIALRFAFAIHGMASRRGWIRQREDHDFCRLLFGGPYH
jgi:hypothetical protein